MVTSISQVGKTEALIKALLIRSDVGLAVRPPCQAVLPQV